MFEDRGLFKDINEENLERIRNHPYFEKSVASIKAKAEEFITTDPPRLKYSEMHIYHSKGTREPFDSKYWAYQTRLACLLDSYLLFKDEKYIEPLADIIYDICNMEMWSGAHCIEETASLEERSTFLELRSTGLGRAVATALYFVGDKLPELVYRRAKHELRRRIIEPYARNYHYWWLRTTLNWAAVCTGNILVTYLCVAEKNEITEQLPRMLHSLDLYISGFDDEGCCPEGYGYWNYGFMHYVPAAILLRDYTDGKIDLFKNPKVHKVALFQQNSAMNDTQDIPFSDTNIKFSPIGWLSHFLKSEYEDVEIPSLEAPANFTSGLHTLCLMNPDYHGSVMRGKSFYYSGAQWFIHRAENYSFVCKGGYNNEPHNHNDIGSFAISKNGKITLQDPGKARYDKDYWDYNDKRYSKYVCCSSRGHSVPVINGEYQIKGKEKCRVHIATENEFSFDFRQAYGIESLKTLNRHIICSEDGVKLTDSYEFTEKPTSVVERFISMDTEPAITADGVVVGDSVIKYDAGKVSEPVISIEEFISDSGVRKVYQIDFAVKELTESISVGFEFV